jgi:hypothetical protein
MATDPLGEDLAAFAAEPVELLAQEDDGTYQPPDNADDANRMLRRLRSHEARRAEVVARYDAEVRMLAAWRDDRVAGIDRETAALDRALEGWMRSRQEQVGVVTEHLPAGELWLRAGRPSLVVTDEALAVKWAQTHNVAVRTKYEVDKAALGDAVHAGPTQPNLPAFDAGPDHEYRAVVSGDGEIVPGVLYRQPVRRTFTVHPNKGEPDE